MFYDLLGKRPMRLTFILALALVAVTACSGGSSSTPTPKPDTQTVSGIFTIKGITCDQVAGSKYANIPGIPMTIKDGHGATLGSTKLATVGLTRSDQSGCDLRYTIPDVPRADNYVIDGGIVGTLNYTYDELKKHNWQANVIVGN
jgi:hypothetical protein